MAIKAVVCLAQAVTLGVVGCASHPPGTAFQDVRDTVDARTGHQIEWDQGIPHEQAPDQSVQAMLRQPLTVDAAAQIALLNNASLQVEFEEIGIAQADLIQAGLLKNPRLFASARLPDRSPSTADTEFSITEDFLDLFLLAARRKLAATQLEQAKRRVGNAVLILVGQVQSAYYTLQAAQQSQVLREQGALAAKAAADMANRQHQAGNITDLDLRIEQAAYQRARLEVMQGHSEAMAAGEVLRRLMGLPSKEISWSIVENLPELPSTEVSQEGLESLALDQRLDLAAARTNVIEPAVSLARGGLLGSVNIGVDTERNTDRQNVTGPQLELDLPIFDQRQASIARLHAQLRQYHQRITWLETQVRSEVRMAYTRLSIARQAAALYRDDLVPVQEQIVVLSQRQYNVMALGVYALLQARRDELDTRRAYVESLRDYWIARVALAQVVGGKLPQAVTAPTTHLAEMPPAPATQPMSMPMQEHMHHPGD